MEDSGSPFVSSDISVRVSSLINTLTVLYMALDQQAPITFLVAQRLLVEYPLGALAICKEPSPSISRSFNDSEQKPPFHPASVRLLNERFLYLFRRTLHLDDLDENDDTELWEYVRKSCGVGCGRREDITGTYSDLGSSYVTNIISSSWIPAWMSQDLPDIELVWRLWDVLIVSPPEGIK